MSGSNACSAPVPCGVSVWVGRGGERGLLLSLQPCRADALFVFRALCVLARLTGPFAGGLLRLALRRFLAWVQLRLPRVWPAAVAMLFFRCGGRYDDGADERCAGTPAGPYVQPPEWRTVQM